MLYDLYYRDGSVRWSGFLPRPAHEATQRMLYSFMVHRHQQRTCDLDANIELDTAIIEDGAA